MIKETRLNHAMKRVMPILMIVIAGLSGTSLGHADPGDFGAMPGLWKIVYTPIKQGKPGKPVVEWHCIDEGADPWEAFAHFPIPATAACQRGASRRGNTSLAWQLSCDENPAVKGQGRVDFDSAEHYTGSVTLRGRGEVIRIDGRRHAACTSPSD